jgi:outer membrane protein OmpA-like peptidoglycan-associated protein
MKNLLKPGSIAALLVGVSLGLPAMAQQQPQVKTGASTNPNTPTETTSGTTSGTPATATGQAPLPTKEHEGFWGHLNPFARKKYVNNQLNPVKNRLNELDQIQARNAQQIQDVDRRAQNGIHAAQSTANDANATAASASQTAGQAQQMAEQANDRTQRLNQTVANLDSYHRVNNLDIRFRPGYTLLNSSAKDALSQVVSQAQGQNGYVVEVRAYSNLRGTAGIEHSQRLAESVVRYLAEHQIPVWRIHEIAMGDARLDENGETVRGNVVRVSLMENSLAALNPGNGGSPNGATQRSSAQPSPQGAASQPAVSLQ